MENINSIIERTFLIERVTSLFVYCAVLFAVVFAIDRAKNYKRVSIVLFVYSLFLTIMAFFFVPDSSKDLTRILAYSDYWLRIPFERVIKEEILNSSTPVGNLYIYLCRLTHIDGFLPSLTCFIFYNNVFYIFKKTTIDFGVKQRSLAISILLFMSCGCFLEVISDIKCFLAFSIICRLIYAEFVKRKIVIYHLVFYLAAALFHAAAIPIIILRFLFYVFMEKDDNKTRKFITSAIIVTVSIAALIFFRTYLFSAFEKAKSYLAGGAYSYFWEYLIGAIQWFVFVWILINFYNLYFRDKSNYTCKNLFGFIIATLVLELVFCFEYNIFHRYILITAILISPIAAITCTHSRKSKIDNTIIILSLVILLISCSRGNLCGYKFFKIIN